MPFRPISDEERAGKEAKIKMMKYEIELLSSSIARLEEDIEKGLWYMDPDEFNEMVSWAKETARRDKGC